MKQRITHIEIRRVQNGFVVMALNVIFNENESVIHEPQRAAMVASNSEELARLVQSIADGAELDWLPTCDLPIYQMRQSHYYKTNKKDPAG